MTLEQPGLGSDLQNGLGWEKGATNNVSKFLAQIQLRLITNHAWGSSFHEVSTVLKHRLPLYPLAFGHIQVHLVTYN